MMSAALIENMMFEMMCYSLVVVGFSLYWLRKHRGKAVCQTVAKGACKSLTLSGYASNDSTDDMGTGVDSMETSDAETSSFEASSLSPKAMTYHAPRTHLSNSKGGCTTNGIPQKLREVVNKLSPHDAVTVLGMLNAASINTHQGQNLDNGKNAAAETHKPFRPWTPFQGSSRPCVKTGSRSCDMKAAQVRGNGRQAQGQAGRVEIKATLAQNLAELTDPKRTILLRKVTPLGANVSQLLEIHFSRFGPVEKVLICHNYDNARTDSPQWRLAGPAFVVMSKAEDVAAALEHGSVHRLLHANIDVALYVDHRANKVSAGVDKVLNAPDYPE